MFRLSDGSSSKSFHIGVDPQLQTIGTITTFTDSLIVRNNPQDGLILIPGVHELTLGAIVSGTLPGGNPDLDQDFTVMLIQVISSVGMLKWCLSMQNDIKFS